MTCRRFARLRLRIKGFKFNISALTLAIVLLVGGIQTDVYAVSFNFVGNVGGQDLSITVFGDVGGS